MDREEQYNKVKEVGIAWVVCLAIGGCRGLLNRQRVVGLWQIAVELDETVKGDRKREGCSTR